jgi:hypothetical protein
VQRLVIPHPDIENAFRIKNTGGTRGLRHQTPAVRAPPLQGVKKEGDTGIGEHAGPFARSQGIEVGIGEHEMQESAHGRNRVVHGQRHAGT